MKKWFLLAAAAFSLCSCPYVREDEKPGLIEFCNPRCPRNTHPIAVAEWIDGAWACVCKEDPI